MATVKPTPERPPDLGREARPVAPQTERSHDGNGRAAGRVQEVDQRHAVATAPAPARQHEPLPSLELEPAPRKRRRRLLLLVPILLVVGAIGLTIGYRYWYDSTYFVMTDNAQVTGDLVQ